MKAALFLLPLTLLTTGCVTNEQFLNTAQSLLNTTQTTNASALSADTIALGLKEALNVGSQTVVAQLGKTGGFNLDPKIRIPLPATLQNINNTLGKVGMNSLTADLETKMNQAAELAVPEAKALFLSAIKQMTIADARSILSGQQDAATQYLRKTMGAELALKVNPIVGNMLAKTGAVQAYDRVLGQYASLPFLSNVKTDMNSYVTEKALDGVFYYVAHEEAQIRQNPAKRTTELLKTVFGQ